ncbi:MAG: hypothetical protein E7591_02700 [Ruminococcaceae bacterium]|nr:hypothetical protein [Oscillospiraceae bacterium]
MAKCNSCGFENVEGEVFCAECGQAINQAPKAPKAPEAPVKKEAAKPAKKEGKKLNLSKEGLKDLFKIIDGTSFFEKEDIEKNKIMSLFAYIGILFLIPMFACKDSKFARFHTNQGIVLCIFYVVAGVVTAILEALPVLLFVFIKAVFFKIIFGALIGIIGLLAGVVNIALLALMILGIISAVTGKAKKLPIIGNIRILK